nr:hypothetical protein [Tanacetum cinerariifolium]
MLARSVAPVKSSAMQPNRGRGVEVLIFGSSVVGGFGGRQGDAWEDLDHGGIVFTAEACGRGLHEHLVFDEDIHSRQRRVISLQDVRHAVFEHPRVAGTVGDHFVQRIGVDALAQAQRHGFGARSDVHAGQQLVDDFDFGAQAM